MRNLTILLFILVFQIFGNNNQIFKNMSGVAVVLTTKEVALVSFYPDQVMF